MPNSIKIAEGSIANALTAGSVHIGVGGKGPTSTTGFYTGINPPSGGYTVYYNKSGGPSITTKANDAALIAEASGASGETFTTIAQALAYYADQSDKMVMHNPIDKMVTNGLVFYLNANIIPSYPRSGTSWIDISGEANNGTLTNGPTFNSTGWIEFDGVDDRISVGNPTSLNFVTDVSCEVVFKRNSNAVTNLRLLSKGGGGASTSQNGFSYFGSNTSIAFACTNNAVRNIQSATITTGKWYHVVGIIDQTSNKIKVYLNGVLTNNATLSGTGTMVGTSDLNIGMFGNSSLPWDGDIENVKIYSTPLTEAEVFQNYYQGSIVTDGLVFAADAGNLISYENGETTAYSLTGSFSGTLTNGVAFNGGNGGSFDFDGTDDYIVLDNNLVSAVGGSGNDTEYTLEAWIYVRTSSGTTTNADNIIGHTSTTGFGMQVGTINSKPRINYGARSDSNFYGSTFEYNEWVHIVLTRRSLNPECHAYLNGVLDVSSTRNLDILSPADGDLTIGGGGGRVTGYFDGLMGPVKVYSKELTAEEVAQNYNATVNRYN